MQGKNQHVMRSGCALWLIVKCCPGAHRQTPLNGLHSRKQSVAVTKGLVGTSPVMIDLQWICEDVSENWVSPESCSGQRECPQTWTCGIISSKKKLWLAQHKWAETLFKYRFTHSFICRIWDASVCLITRGILIGMANYGYLHTSFIQYVNCKLLHKAM